MVAINNTGFLGFQVNAGEVILQLYADPMKCQIRIFGCHSISFDGKCAILTSRSNGFLENEKKKEKNLTCCM